MYPRSLDLPSHSRQSFFLFLRCTRSQTRNATLASYVESYLRQEVIEEGRTRNLAAFSRFLESASFSQAASLNVARVARDVGVDRNTAAAYFELLEDLMIASRVPVFAKRAKRRMTAHPKFYFFDAGVYRAIRPAGPLDSPEEIDGSALETLVYQDLRAAIAYGSLKLGLYFWRTASGAEVDFVAYGDDGLFAIEVKRSRTVRGRRSARPQTVQERLPDGALRAAVRWRPARVPGMESSCCPWPTLSLTRSWCSPRPKITP